MKKMLVDTDVLIDYSKGYDRFLGEILKKQEAGEVEAYVTPVTIAEYMTDLSLRNAKLRQHAVSFLGLFSVVEIGKTAGVLAGQYLREGKTDYLGDALTAGTAVALGMELVTRNRRHFVRIPGLVLGA